MNECVSELFCCFFVFDVVRDIYISSNTIKWIVFG